MIGAEVETVHAAFAAAAARWPERPAFHLTTETAAAYGLNAGDISYRAALQTVEARIGAYRAAGCGGGMRVGLMLGNRPEFFIEV